jgi:phosphate transport system protein
MASVHTSREFEAELRELRAHALAMGARCERIFKLALDAFFCRSPEEATRDIDNLDRQIDRDEMDIDALVLRILALRQPVAHDLRFLAAALKLVTDLERVGDESVNIAERTREGPGKARDCAREHLLAMSEDAQEMLREALEAFVRADVEIAERVLGRDDAVDERYGVVLREMEDFMKREPAEGGAAIRVILVARYLERVADHATNIAEEVIFMVRGEDVRHPRTQPHPHPHPRVALQ